MTDEPALSHRLIKNVAWNLAGQFWMLALSFFATPFIVRSLNVSLYGIYTLVWVIIGYFSFLQFGLGTAATKYIASYYSSKDEQAIRRIFWACIIIYSAIGTAGTVAIALLSRFIVDNVLGISPELRGTALFVIRIGSMGFLITVMMSVLNGVIQAVGRFDMLNLRGIVFGTLQILMTVVLLAAGLSLKEVVISTLLIDAAGICVLWAWARKILPFLAQPVWDKRSAKDLFRFGGFVTVSGVIGPVLANTEKLFLTSLRSVAVLTYYSVPFNLVDKLTCIRGAFSSVLFPAFSSLQDSRDRKFNLDLYDRSVLYILFSYYFFVIFFIVFGDRFLSAWIGQDFAFYSHRILSVLAVAGAVNAAAAPSLNVLQGFNKPQVPALFHFIEAVFYIPCAYLLILRFGGIGAAIAWLLRVLLDTALLHRASCGLFKEPVLRWYVRLFKKSLIPVCVCGFSLYAFRAMELRFFSLTNICGITIIFLLYIFIVWKLGLDDFARQRIREFVTGLSLR